MRAALFLLLLLTGCAERPHVTKVKRRLVAEMLTEDLWIVAHPKDAEVKYYRTYYKQEEFCPRVERLENECDIGEIAGCIVKKEDGSCSLWTCSFEKRKTECDVYFRQHTEERALDENSPLYRGRNDFGTFVRVDMKDQYEFYGTFYY